MVKGYFIEDKDIKYVKLPNGNWSLDGELVINDNWQEKDYQVKSFDNIVKIEKKSVLKTVIYNNTVYTGEEYTKIINDLLDYQDEDGYWDNLDKEFEYKKLIRDSTLNYREIEVIGEPQQVVIIKTKYNTGNPNITPKFENSDATGIFIYYRSNALFQIVKDIFDELEFKFIEDVYYHQTEDVKVWGTNKRKDPDSVTAFGTYIFKAKYERISNFTGTLEYCIEKYNIDLKEVKDSIMTLYNLNYGKIDLNKNINEIYSKVKTINSSFSSLDYKKADRTKYLNLKTSLNELDSLLLKTINNQ